MPQAFLFDVIYEAYQQVRILVSENGCVGVLKNTPVLGDLLEEHMQSLGESRCTLA